MSNAILFLRVKGAVESEKRQLDSQKFGQNSVVYHDAIVSLLASPP